MDDVPIIVVYDKHHAVAALQAAAEFDIAVLLVSQRGGDSIWGPEGFKALIRQSADMVPEAKMLWALDCADNAGRALAACRTTVDGIVFDRSSPAFERVKDIANKSGVAVYDPKIYEGDILDLSPVGEAEAACHTFLQNRRGAG